MNQCFKTGKKSKNPISPHMWDTFGAELSKLSSHHTIEHVERTTTLFSANESNQQIGLSSK